MRNTNDESVAELNGNFESVSIKGNQHARGNFKAQPCCARGLSLSSIACKAVPAEVDGRILISANMCIYIPVKDSEKPKFRNHPMSPFIIKMGCSSSRPEPYPPCPPNRPYYNPYSQPYYGAPQQPVKHGRRRRRRGWGTNAAILAASGGNGSGGGGGGCQMTAEMRWSVDHSSMGYVLVRGYLLVPLESPEVVNVHPQIGRVCRIQHVLTSGRFVNHRHRCLETSSFPLFKNQSFPINEQSF